MDAALSFVAEELLLVTAGWSLVDAVTLFVRAAAALTLLLVVAAVPVVVVVDWDAAEDRARSSANRLSELERGQGLKGQCHEKSFQTETVGV